MKHQSARELFQYWNRLRGSEKAPARGALDPSDIRAILGDTFLLEVLGPDSCRFRLAGTRICSTYCRELKGQDFLAFWQADDRPALTNLVTSITTEATAGILDVSARNDRGQTVSLEILLLPLRQHDQEFNRIIGVLAASNPPYWLGIHPIVEQRIVGLDRFRPDHDRTVIALPASPRTAPPPPLAGAVRRRPFVVVQGGKS